MTEQETGQQVVPSSNGSGPARIDVTEHGRYRVTGDVVAHERVVRAQSGEPVAPHRRAPVLVEVRDGVDPFRWTRWNWSTRPSP
jgi:hypothetical protein